MRAAFAIFDNRIAFPAAAPERGPVLSRAPGGGLGDRLEQVEPFACDTNGYSTDTLDYDPAGNLTYDGSQAYGYDAWNRLTQVAHAYKDADGTLHKGQTFSASGYDGLGRRISKTVTGTGSWDCAYHYYYDGQRPVETRDGSDRAMKQQVWGGWGTSTSL